MWKRVAGAVGAAVAMATGAALLAGVVDGDAGPAPKAVGVVVERVDSGDTITLINGGVLRLANIDAPQITRDDCVAAPARDQLRALVAPGTVIGVRSAGLPQRPGEPARVYVFTRGKNVNLTLVKRGAAGVWLMGTRRDRYTRELLTAGRRAKQLRHGLWGTCPSTPFAVRQPLRTIRPHGMWVPERQLMRLPTAGPAWDQLEAAAARDLGRPDPANRDSDHDVLTLAAALVFARTRQEAYRQKVVRTLEQLVAEKPRDGFAALAYSRNVPSYAIAADLVDLRDAAPRVDARVRGWLRRVRDKRFRDGNIVDNHETRANNYGTMAGAARLAIALYLRDANEVTRVAEVFRGWLGDRRFPTDFPFNRDRSWQADAANPVGVNPPRARTSGASSDGALPAERRRGCRFRRSPCHTSYPWEALQGAAVQAQLLHNVGYDTARWGSQALRRAVRYLHRLSRRDARWWSETRGVPEIVNSLYGTRFPTEATAVPGRNIAWTAWTHGG
jgi:endonuclease YncB( thermonuclease family)